MNIGIIDAEIIGKTKHRFPNLACMKISSYYKSQGHNVELLLDYDSVDKYDKVFVSKVFIKTDIPNEPEDKNKTEQNVVEYYQDNAFLHKPNIKFGGTGFYYEKAPKLDANIEHCMPDYHLYDKWVEDCIANGANPKEFTYYKDYSIGFLTRGCFRKCQFCVNKVYNKCSPHSSLSEFIDNDRKKLCFLDDNFLACPNSEEILNEVLATGKRFQFKQGLDERLLNVERIEMLKKMDKKYDGEFIFAFDNIEDKDLIISKLDKLYELYPDWKHQMKFYCFCGYDRNDKYDLEFWIQDLKDLFERIFILSKYSCFPYIMRHENYKNSPFKDMYNNIAGWCNQPNIFKTFDFYTYCICRGMKAEGYKKYKRDIDGYLKEYTTKYNCWRSLEKFISDIGDWEEFHILPKDISEYGIWIDKKGEGD